MTIDKDILDYVTRSQYEEAISNLKNNEFKRIYNSKGISIKLFKKGNKIYTIINRFGTKKLDEALNNMISLAV